MSFHVPASCVRFRSSPCSLPVLWSQTAGTGTLVGTVTDTSGAVVAAAKVSVVNIDTSFSSQVVTTAEGSYYVPYLAPGTYRITIESPGFKEHVRDNFAIRTGEVPRVDVQLEVGALSEMVEVNSAAPLLDTETSQAGLVFSGERC